MESDVCISHYNYFLLIVLLSVKYSADDVYVSQGGTSCTILQAVRIFPIYEDI